MFNQWVQRLLRLNQKLTGKKLKIIQHDLNYHIMNSDPNTESTINHNITHNTTRKHQRVSSEDGFLFFNLRSNFRFDPTYTHESKVTKVTKRAIVQQRQAMVGSSPINLNRGGSASPTPNVTKDRQAIWAELRNGPAREKSSS